MKNSEIEQMTDKEVQERIGEEKLILRKMKISHAVSPLENPNKIPETRRNIARLMTEWNKRQSSAK
ncbi:MAG: 50S ribosomal protein L29 [Bacteroidales bacterium]|jgi:large subunit ribosomal protein L29|nr:50S ribosomal protein L29 [Bacteroidales bacterium]